MVIILQRISRWKSTTSPLHTGFSDYCTARFTRSSVLAPTKHHPQRSGDEKLCVSSYSYQKIYESFFLIFSYNRIDDLFHVKLTDMALSRDFFPNDYHCLGDNENRPIKWMAMESLTRREFSTASDIVSLIPSFLKNFFQKNHEF